MDINRSRFHIFSISSRPISASKIFLVEEYVCIMIMIMFKSRLQISDKVTPVHPLALE